MSDEQGSGASKQSKKGIAVALGVALPLATSLYTQRDERAAQSRNEQQQEQALFQAALERDLTKSYELEQRLIEAWPDAPWANADYSKLCRQLAREVSKAEGGSLARQTLKTLIDEFALPADDKGAGSARTVACRCPTETLLLQGALKQPEPAPSRPRLLPKQRIKALERLDDLVDGCATAAATIPPPESPKPNPPATRSIEDDARDRAAQIAELRMRVYVQSPKAGDPSTDCLQQQLRQFGYILPKLDVVGPARSPKRTQVRYVRADELQQATSLVADVALVHEACKKEQPGQFTTLAPPTEPSDFTRFSGASRPYHFELWIGTEGQQP